MVYQALGEEERGIVASEGIEFQFCKMKEFRNLFQSSVNIHSTTELKNSSDGEFLCFFFEL